MKKVIAAALVAAFACVAPLQAAEPVNEEPGFSIQGWWDSNW